MEKSNALFADALNFFRARNFTGAENICRQILSENPRHAHSLHMMAAIGLDIGNYDVAAELARMALAEAPEEADFYYTLGAIYKKQEKPEDAMAFLQKAIDLNPKHLRALLDLADICRDIGAITRNNNMLAGALSFYTRALAIRADEETYHNIGYVYYAQENYQQAADAAKAALKRYPHSIKNLIGLASSLDQLSMYEEALGYYQNALDVEPDNPIIHANMANTLKHLSRTDDAIAAQKKALKYAPKASWVYSNLLLTMIYASSVSPEELASTSMEFGKQIADPLLRTRPFTNDRDPNRKLRIGYVSPDFRNHVIAHFLSPIYHCDKDNFELFAYSKNEVDHETTAYIKKYFDHWRDIKFTNDDKAADMIEADKIDILVDLAGHTARNGLMIFARKPAPIQVTWLGHPATTGMKAMDYRITDHYAEPIGMTEHLNSETLWRLPDIFCAYQASNRCPDVIDHPPFEDNGYVTFGCFNNFTKVSDPALKTWAEILHKVPDARLLLEIPGIDNPKILAEVESRLANLGLPMDRLILVPRSSANQYVLYNKIDMALDPFPCVGGTTSMDTLWMGVPFVTLAGKHFTSRMGVTILTNAGMPELIAQNTEDYISIAVNMASDKDALRKIRQGLRERFADSPVMDREKFAKNMEIAYRQMWKKWLEDQGTQDA